MTDIFAWAETDDSNDSAAPAGFPELMAPSGVNDSARAVMGAVRRWYSRATPSRVSTGSANAQVLTYTVPPLDYQYGDTFAFTAGFTNTGAMTLQVAPLAAKAVLRIDGQPCGAGDIRINHLIEVWYDGASLRLKSDQTLSLPITGGEVTGGIRIAPPSGSAQLILSKPAGANGNDLLGQVAGVTRWIVQLGTGEAESGANAGSNFSIQRYADGGTYINSPLTINRATGDISAYNALYLNTYPTADEHAAHKYYVDTQDVAHGALKVSKTGDTMSGALSVPYIYGGPGTAGTLRTYGTNNAVTFVWSGNNLHWRIDDVLQAMICVTENASHFNTGAYGPLSAGLSFKEISTGNNFIIYVDAVSDERVKLNIGPSEIDALSLMRQIEVARFDVEPRVAAWFQNSAEDAETRAQAMAEAGEPMHVALGLVAQQVRPLIPEAVHVAAQDDIASDCPLPPDVHSISLQAIVPYLVRAVQQLAERVEALEARS